MSTKLYLALLNDVTHWKSFHFFQLLCSAVEHFPFTETENEIHSIKQEDDELK